MATTINLRLTALHFLLLLSALVSLSQRLIAAEPAPPWVAQPAHTFAPIQTVPCRIVSFGDDLSRADAAPMGTAFRGGLNSWPWQYAQDRDVNGNGKTDDDFVGYLPFSLTEPLNPPFMPEGGMLPEVLNGRFYGGITYYFADTNRANRPFNFENYVNPDHNGPFYDARAEDFAISGAPDGKNPACKYQHYAVFIWKKDDFRNGGDRYRVTFDDHSRLAVFIARYWYGYTDGRFVVQDGDQFFISQQAFDIPDWVLGNNWFNGKPYVLSPTKTRWAPYHPNAPYHIDFDATHAAFADHQFTDVRAVGWYIARPDLAATETHVKWYAFEVDATVDRPARASESMTMARVPATDAIPDFLLSTCEVPYALWKQIYHLATRPTYATDPGYLFQKIGAMGSMQLGDKTHQPDEPVTNITWYDALAFCNALSESEGKTPCYYTDAACTNLFRFNEIATYAFFAKNEKIPTFETHALPKIYVKWEADGYRLPTLAEWIAARDAGKASPDDTWTDANAGGVTHPVGSGKADALGLYDMLGNVWEYCWDAGEVFDPTTQTTHTVVGGDMHSPADPRTRAASPYGDTPYDGAYNIGFRLLRRVAGEGKPALGHAPDQPGYATIQQSQQWTFANDTHTTPAAPAEKATTPILPQVDLPAGSFTRLYDRAKISVSAFSISADTIPYAKWRQVADWARAHGYTFAHDGSMGSMYWYNFPHTPDEPVTDVSWHDAIVWCNALSEMEGKTPCYYTDEGCHTMYRAAFAYQPIKIPGDVLGASYHLRDSWAKYQRGSELEPWLFVKWEADGYRLPTMAEWEYAAHAGADTRYFWGTAPDHNDLYAWDGSNSGNTTHPVGKKQPNKYGLYDIVGNVYQWIWSTTISGEDYYDNMNPKGSRYGDYAKREYKGFPLLAGGSFAWGNMDVGGGWMREGGFGMNATIGYPDIGFRPVRCAANTHPHNENETPERVALDFDPKTFDPLIGSAYRGSLRRDGVFPADGIAHLPALKWKFATGGPVKSSPIVVNGIAYIGSTDGFFYAVDADTGAEKWKYEVKGRTGKGVESPACVANGVVFFGGDDGLLYAVDAATGALKWKFAAPDAWKREPVKSAPAVAYHTVFAVVGDVLRGVDIATGKQVWELHDAAAPAGRSAVTIADTMIYAGGAWGQVVGISLRNERQLWIGYSGSTGVVNTPALADGKLYSLCSTGMEAFDALTGHRIWQTKLDNTLVMNEFKTNSSPAIYHNTAYVGMDNGNLYALDATTGAIKWKKPLPAPIWSSPTIAGGIIYIGAHDSTLYALDAADGSEKWHYQTGGIISSSAWIANGVIYLSSEDGNLYALEGK